MKLRIDTYPKFIEIDEKEKLFFTKEDLINIFWQVDKDKQIQALIPKLVIRNSNLSFKAFPKDIYLYDKKVGFFSYLLEKEGINIRLFQSSNFYFSDWEFIDYDTEVFKLDRLNIPYLWHAIMYHIVTFSKNLGKKYLKLVSSSYAYKKWFYDEVFDYFEKKGIIKRYLNYGHKYLAEL